MDRRQFVSAVAAMGSLSLARASSRGESSELEIVIRPDRKLGKFPHYWSACAGSGHARLGLQAQWQRDLKLAHERAGIRAVRFHGVLDDDLAVCTGVSATGPLTNFIFVDEIYDRMLELGVRPYVELSFMPRALASSDNTVFWYRANTSPPKQLSEWRALVARFVRHLVERYGLAEVSQWRFECWNEPNLNFWAGSKEQYFELYRHTATAIKGVSPRLQVGGPATAQMMWISEFLAECARNDVPVDFVSSHIYPDDPQENVFGHDLGLAPDEVMPRAMMQANEQIRASAYPHVPLVISEWSSRNPAFIAQMVRDCAGLADTMSYWTFSNVFEEQGPNRTFMNETYGMIGTRGIPRPTFRTFELLNKLGNERLESGAGPVLATLKPGGALAVMAWHLVPEDGADRGAGNPVATLHRQHAALSPPLPLHLKVAGISSGSARVTLVDPGSDPVARVYAAMGAPLYPSVQQIHEMRNAGLLQPPQERRIEAGYLDLILPPSSAALVEIG